MDAVRISVGISKSVFARFSLFQTDYSLLPFRFALRGHVIDLALGIIIGAAFTNVVQSLVDDIITPPLGLVIGGVDVSNLTINITNFVYKDKPPVVIRYGRFVQRVLYLLIVALVLFCIMKGVGRFYRLARKKKEKAQEEIQLSAPNEELQVLKQIRDLLAAQKATEIAEQPPSLHSMKPFE